ncbi:phosphoribosylformylglycinamidine synthase subunit PurS [Candidatus Woesearchaeota archaeon]|nr:phosphoribosylformylglycinamidine synthase subunit PurS [Candidatus Woesearchaeota archaeon]
MPIKTVEMVVSLKVPDTTAITALQTLQKIGFSKIMNVARSDYYKFSIEGDEKKFMNQICKADILVNANKHAYAFSVPKESSIKILVKNINGGESSILTVLKNRLGFKNIEKIEKATLWSLSIEADEKEARKIADKAAGELLVNEHYQEYEILQVNG